jgi:hypothetical protein
MTRGRFPSPAPLQVYSFRTSREILAFGVLGEFAEQQLVEVDRRGEDSVPAPGA